MPDPIAPAQGAATDDGAEERISAAVSKHFRSHLGKALEEALTPHLTAFREQIAPKADPKAPAAASTAGADSEVGRQLEEMRGQLKKEQEARATERQATREGEAFAALRAELAGKVRPEAIDTVAKLLFHADKLVRVDKAGKVSVHLEDDEHSLAEGVARWVKSPAAALFVPAPGYGAGKKPAARAPGRGSDARPAAANETALQRTQRQLAALAAKNGVDRVL